MRIPFPSAPVHRTRNPGNASARSTEGVSPSIINFLGLPFAGEEAVNPSIINFMGLPFAGEDAVSPSIINFMGLPFAEDCAE